SRRNTALYVRTLSSSFAQGRCRACSWNIRSASSACPARPLLRNRRCARSPMPRDGPPQPLTTSEQVLGDLRHPLAEVPGRLEITHVGRRVEGSIAIRLTDHPEPGPQAVQVGNGSRAGAPAGIEVEWHPEHAVLSCEDREVLQAVQLITTHGLRMGEPGGHLVPPPQVVEPRPEALLGERLEHGGDAPHVRWAPKDQRICPV